MKSLPLMAGLAFCILTSAGSFNMKTVAQQTAPSPAVSEINPAEVATPDAILKTAYDTISGPAGKKREWNRFRALFVPGARLIPTGPNPAGAISARVLSVEDYIQASSSYLETNGFYERDIARRTERFGNIAHVFSTYESRHKADDPKPFARGINSFQLMYDGHRWWIVTIFWQAESPNNPIPKKYLKGGKTGFGTQKFPRLRKVRGEPGRK